MRPSNSCLFPATCTIILAVTTYATATQATRQIQAEAKLPTQQVAVASPSRSLKYGDKTTKKLPNQEVHFLPTSPSIEKFKNKLPSVEKQTLSRNRSSLRAQQPQQDQNQELVTQISRRLDIITKPNQLDEVYEVPIVHKTSELKSKQRTTTVSQQRTPAPSRSRIANSAKQIQIQQRQQPTQYHNLNIESEKDIAKTKEEEISAAKTSYKSRQRMPTTTTTTISPSKNVYQQIPLAAHNSNVRTHHLTDNNNNTTIVRHHHRNQRNKNNTNTSINYNSSNSQPLLTSDAVAATGLQRKTESSSYSRRQTGNVSSNQSVTSNSTNKFRSRGRKPPSNASTATIISSPSTSVTTTITSKLFGLHIFINNFFLAPNYIQILTNFLSYIQTHTYIAIP